MADQMMWHFMNVVRPKKNIHILAELDDHTLISGNMSEYDGEPFFMTDSPLDLTECAEIAPDEIIRWCIAPESD